MTAALWVDATHGAAGDMLLGALLDAGADLDAVLAAFGRLADAGSEPLTLAARPVRRHGLRATHAIVETPTTDVRRGPSQVHALVSAAGLSCAADAFAHAVFDALARAEARVHGVSETEIHFHEVGALDSLADVVGCAVALDSLELLGPSVVRQVSTIGLGGGTARSAHGRIPVPVPATLELLAAVAAPVSAGPGDRELCTPTGAALLSTLATSWGGLPELTVRATGSGAGMADPVDRPNLLRVVIGDAMPDAASAGRWRTDDLLVVEATVDDLDPRLWPGVLDKLVTAGAQDAWLTNVLMRKGRPGHVVTALTAPGTLDSVFRTLVTTTTTLGARVHGVARQALHRDTIRVDVNVDDVDDVTVEVKRGLLDGVVVTLQPEFDDVLDAAHRLGITPVDLLARARAAAERTPRPVARP